MYSAAASRIEADARRHHKGEVDSATRAFDSHYRPSGTVRVKTLHPMVREDHGVIPVGTVIDMAGDQVASAVQIGVVERL